MTEIAAGRPRVGACLWCGCLFVVAVTTGCSNDNATSYVDKIKRRGELVVLTRNAPTTYYEGREGKAGFEYEMASAFARRLGVRPRFHVMDTISDLLEAVRRGQGDIAAAGLTRTAQRRENLLFGPVYQNVRQQVVCHRDGPRPRDVAELSHVHLKVIADSSYVELLRKLKLKNPALTWSTDADVSVEQLLQKVWKRRLDCTIADSTIVAINRRYYPEVTVAFNLSRPQPLAWALPPRADDLRDAVDDWFDSFKRSGRLQALLDKYYGYIPLFDYVDTRAFMRRIKRVLPRYRRMFQAAAGKYGIPWTLLAAQAYQESHWVARAESPTGVRGMMMLTLTTARELGIESRLNARQSIMGGARYLDALRDRFSDGVGEPDRTWFALAAYNLGIGHVEDALRLAARLGKKTGAWKGLADVLPLLSQKRYYHTLAHGYARGDGAVDYVDQIRDYQGILEHQVQASSDAD